MADEDMVMRNAPASRTQKLMNDAMLKQFQKQAAAYQLPEKAALENALESREKCKKCQGETRAMLQDLSPHNGVTFDVEILVELNCRDAECKWTERTWRPWKKSAPLEL